MLLSSSFTAINDDDHQRRIDGAVEPERTTAKELVEQWTHQYACINELILAGQIRDALVECRRACYGLLSGSTTTTITSSDFEYFDDGLFDHTMTRRNRKRSSSTSSPLVVTVPLSVLEIRRQIIRVTLSVALCEEAKEQESYYSLEKDFIAVLVQRALERFPDDLGLWRVLLDRLMRVCTTTINTTINTSGSLVALRRLLEWFVKVEPGNVNVRRSILTFYQLIGDEGMAREKCQEWFGPATTALMLPLLPKATEQPSKVDPPLEVEVTIPRMNDHGGYDSDGDWLEFWERLVIAVDRGVIAKQAEVEESRIGGFLYAPLTVRLVEQATPTPASGLSGSCKVDPTTSDDEDSKMSTNTTFIRSSARQRQQNTGTSSQWMRSSDGGPSSLNLLSSSQQQASPVQEYLPTIDEAKALASKILGPTCTEASNILPLSASSLSLSPANNPPQIILIKAFYETYRSSHALSFASVRGALKGIIECSVGGGIFNSYSIPPPPHLARLIRPLARLVDFWLSSGALDDIPSAAMIHQLLRMAQILELTEDPLYRPLIEALLGRLQLCITDEEAQEGIDTNHWIWAQMAWLRSRIARPDWERVEGWLGRCRDHLLENTNHHHGVDFPNLEVVQRALEACEREKVIMMTGNADDGGEADDRRGLAWICANVLGVSSGLLGDPKGVLARLDRTIWLRVCRLVSGHPDLAKEYMVPWHLAEAYILIDEMNQQQIHQKHQQHQQQQHISFDAALDLRLDEMYERLVELLESIRKLVSGPSELRFGRLVWSICFEWPLEAREQRIKAVRPIKARRNSLSMKERPEITVSGWRLFWTLTNHHQNHGEMSGHDGNDPWRLVHFCLSWIKAHCQPTIQRAVLAGLARYLLEEHRWPLAVMDEAMMVGQRRLVWCLASFVFGLPAVFYPKRQPLNPSSQTSQSTLQSSSTVPLPLPSPPARFDERALVGSPQFASTIAPMMVEYLLDCLYSGAVVVNVEEFNRVIALLTRHQMSLYPAPRLIHELYYYRLNMARIRHHLRAAVPLQTDSGDRMDSWYGVDQRGSVGEPAWFLEHLTLAQMRLAMVSTGLRGPQNRKRSSSIILSNTGSSPGMATIDQLEGFIEQCLIHVSLAPVIPTRWSILVMGLCRFIMTVLTWDTASLAHVQECLVDRVRMALRAYRIYKRMSLDGHEDTLRNDASDEDPLEVDVAMYRIVLLSVEGGVLEWFIEESVWSMADRKRLLTALTLQLAPRCLQSPTESTTTNQNDQDEGEDGEGYTSISDQEEDEDQEEAPDEHYRSSPKFTIDPLTRTRLILGLAELWMAHGRPSRALGLHLYLLGQLDRRRLKGSGVGADQTYWTVFEAIRAVDEALPHCPIRTLESYLQRLFGEIRRICGANVVVMESERRMLLLEATAQDDNSGDDDYGGSVASWETNTRNLIHEWMGRLGKLDRRKNQHHLHLHWLALRGGSMASWARLFPWMAAPPRLHTKPATVQHHLFINVWQNEQDLPGAYLVYTRRYTLDLAGFLIAEGSEGARAFLVDLMRRVQACTQFIQRSKTFASSVGVVDNVQLEIYRMATALRDRLGQAVIDQLGLICGIEITPEVTCESITTKTE